MQRLVLLGGGAGFIGRAIKRAFEFEGYKVTVISREDRKDTVTWDRILKVGLPEGTSYVVNAAGANVLDFTRRWNDKYKAEVINSRVGTNKLLAEAIDKAENKPLAFLTMSGVGIYKADPDILYDESTEIRAFDFFSKLVIDWENATKTKSNVRRISMRSGVVLGRDGGMIKQIYPSYLMNLGGPMGSGKQYFPWIHVDDLAGAIIHVLLRLPDVEGPINAVSPEIITNERFSQAYAASMNRKCYIKVPTFMVNLIFGTERAAMILEGQQVHPKRLWSELKYKYLYRDIKSACEGIMYEY